MNWQTDAEENPAKFRRLDSQCIVETVQALHARIDVRFPGSGLGQVVAELQRVAEETVARTEWIQRPHLALRAGVAFLCLGIGAMLFRFMQHVHQFQVSNYSDSVQALEATVNSVVFIGASILFLVTWEDRIKRSRALKAVHELRAMAHIVDMHQLTKDPESCVEGAPPTSKQRRMMTPFQLSRYLDYCGDSLALISKIAALYVQEFQDPVLLSAVDEVENLTSGFARKIWQKLTILEDLYRSCPRPSPSRSEPASSESELAPSNEE